MRSILRFAWRHPWVTALVLVTGFLMSINGAVIVLGGGSPHPLSVRFLPGKLTALGAWARHAPVHFFRSCGEDRDEQLRLAAERHGVPASLVRAVALAESGGGAHRISHAGAMGVMQLMPPTARDLRVVDAFDAGENIDGGVRYLAWLWRRYDGDVQRVVAAYNAGPGVIPRTGVVVLPNETRHYVKRVLTRDVVESCGRHRTNRM